MSDDPTATARPGVSLSARPDYRAGQAPIKAEYLLNPTHTAESNSSSTLNDRNAHPFADDDAAEGQTSTANPDARDNKRQKHNKRDKDRTGQNKARSFPVMREAGVRTCRAWEQTGTCPKEACKFAHGWDGYFKTKPPDIHHECAAMMGEVPPYVKEKERMVGGDDELGKTVDMGTECPVLSDLGYCPYGWRCRFLGGHVRWSSSESAGDEGATERIGDWELLGKQGESSGSWRNRETNWSNLNVMSSLRGNSYEYPFSEKYLYHVEPHKAVKLTRKNIPVKQTNGAVSEEDGMNGMMSAEEAVMSAPTTNGMNGNVDGESEAMDVPSRPEEKRRLNWDGGLYLAPLTTVGNLPFRRLCVSYGATITCSEMALAQPLISGHSTEWALVRRHDSEKMFGVQLAGGYANQMVPTAEMVRKEIGDGADFVDVNLGCPIDLVFNQGAGSALLDSPGRLGKILVGMNRALGDIPLTVKFRTGVANSKRNAHKLIPRFATEWGASAMTVSPGLSSNHHAYEPVSQLHGRSRQQRYSKLADWAYIRECAGALRSSLSDAGLPPVPIFGNGDCFSAQGYYEEKEASGVDGIMVARGALIKPWIFTEIAERREWDISATERLEGIRKYAEFGLSHWGSDAQGVSITRRFLCEALSFQHRYIPIGLLETLPPRLNERPPAYRGRNELETLLRSPFSGDWVKVSEMFLGKVEEGWKFTPKHKSNAYGAEEAQG